MAATLADMHSAVTAAIGALKGPLHGGANEAVFYILQAIDKAKADPIDYVKNMLAQKKKVPGFGHRVYHTEDPRATHLRHMSADLGKSSGQRKWFEMSHKIEEFVKAEKKLNATWTSTPPPPTRRWGLTSICLPRYSPSANHRLGPTSSSNSTTTGSSAPAPITSGRHTRRSTCYRAPLGIWSELMSDAFDLPWFVIFLRLRFGLPNNNISGKCSPKASDKSPTHTRISVPAHAA